MADLKLRRRKRLRRKDITSLNDDFEDKLGCRPFGESDNVENAEAGEYKLILLDGVPQGIYIEDTAFLLIRGILKFKPQRLWVTVDMGAVKFLANGADVMSPGIIDADPTVKAGEPVWIRDERNIQPLAVGIAKIDGEAMVSSDSGKAIKTIHYIGDKIWQIGED